MTDKHTPGPWEPKRIESQRWEIDAPNGDPTIGHKLWQGLAAVYGCDDMSAAGAQVAEANARLIAAAPAMLTMLRELRECAEYWSEYDVPLGIVERLDSVIKQATGETN